MSTTKSDYLATVFVDGQPWGTFDTCTGGEVDADVNAKFTADGYQVYHAKGKPGDVTVSRDYVLERDHELSRAAFKRVGRAQVTVSKQPLDADGNVWGKPIVYEGLLQHVTPPDYDANASDASTFDVVVRTRSVA